MSFSFAYNCFHFSFLLLCESFCYHQLKAVVFKKCCKNPKEQCGICYQEVKHRSLKTLMLHRGLEETKAGQKIKEEI